MLDVTEARALLKRERHEGRQEGRVEGLRIAIEAYCEAVGIALDDARHAWLAEASADDLEARLALSARGIRAAKERSGVGLRAAPRRRRGWIATRAAHAR